jgi:hypothetical protein
VVDGLPPGMQRNMKLQALQLLRSLLRHFTEPSNMKLLICSRSTAHFSAVRNEN